MRKCRDNGTVRQASEGNIIRRMRFVCWITKGKIITRTLLNVTLHVHCLSYFRWVSCFGKSTPFALYLRVCEKYSTLTVC